MVGSAALLEDLLAQHTLRHPGQRESCCRRVAAGRQAGRLLLADPLLGRFKELADQTLPVLGDLLIVGRDFAERLEQHGVLTEESGDIGHAIQKFAEAQGFSVVREFCGHGIGQVFHEEPQVLHYGRPGTLEKLVEGMTFTIEPMINAGRKEIKDGPEKDGWTIVTQDRSLSAQWEHTVLVTPTGYEVLTLSAGSPATPAFVTAAQSQPA